MRPKRDVCSTLIHHTTSSRTTGIFVVNIAEISLALSLISHRRMVRSLLKGIMDKKRKTEDLFFPTRVTSSFPRRVQKFADESPFIFSLSRAKQERRMKVRMKNNA